MSSTVRWMRMLGPSSSFSAITYSRRHSIVQLIVHLPRSELMHGLSHVQLVVAHRQPHKRAIGWPQLMSQAPPLVQVSEGGSVNRMMLWKLFTSHVLILTSRRSTLHARILTIIRLREKRPAGEENTKPTTTKIEKPKEQEASR